ncbi:MAG: hypothetical protein ACXABO_04505 [Promethearchaeota archaeon]
MNNSSSDLLYLIFVKDDIPLFELDFSVDGMIYDSVLMSGFISAIKSFSEMVSKRNLKVIDQGDVKIVFEEYQKVSAFYVTPTVTDELRAKIQDLLQLFEFRYKNELYNKPIESIDVTLFDDFKQEITKVLSKEIIKRYYIIKMTGVTPDESIPKNTFPVISNINGKRTVSEIAKKLNKNTDEIIDLIAYLKSKNLVSFSIFINPYDVPILSSEGLSKLFKPIEDYKELASSLGGNNFKIIKLIDGKSTVVKLAEIASINLSDLKKILNILLSKGYIDILSEELRWCMIFESFYTFYITSLKKLMGKRGINLFKTILEKDDHPLISFIKFSDKDIPSFDAVRMHFENQKIINIRELQELFLSPIIKSFETLKNDVGQKFVLKLKSRINNNLKDLFGPKDIQELENILG